MSQAAVREAKRRASGAYEPLLYAEIRRDFEFKVTVIRRDLWEFQSFAFYDARLGREG